MTEPSDGHREKSMAKYRSNGTQRNAKPRKRRSAQTRQEVGTVPSLKRSSQPRKAKTLSVVDQVEEASKDSFPCSDPPGYGHA
jgi:hypothetical protein